jgi:transcriptional regulator with XRE-family HTH domain
VVEETIGSRVRRARKARGLTQEGLARAADMSLPGVARLEQSGGLDPHYSTLMKLADALEVSPHWLYTGEEEETVSVPKAEAPRPSGRQQAEAEALLKAPGVQDWLRTHDAELLLMTDAEFDAYVKEAVRDPFDVARIMEQLRQERDAVVKALDGDPQGMPEALLRRGAVGATQEEKGFDAMRRRRVLKAWARYRAFQRYVDLMNVGNSLIEAETKDLEAPAATETAKT